MKVEELTRADIETALKVVATLREALHESVLSRGPSENSTFMMVALGALDLTLQKLLEKVKAQQQ